MNRMSTAAKRDAAPSTTIATAQPGAKSVAPLEGIVPCADRLSFRSMLAGLVSHTMGTISRSSDTTNDTTAFAAQTNKETVAQARQSFFSRFFSGVERGLFIAVGAVIEFTRYLAEKLYPPTNSGHGVIAVSTTPETPTTRHCPVPNDSSSKHTEEHKIEAFTFAKTKSDELCVTVAEATRRRDEKKHEEQLHEEERVVRVKGDAEHLIDVIDSANGITNADIAIIKANLEGSYGSTSVAIRAIIEAQQREVDPHKKRS